MTRRSALKRFGAMAASVPLLGWARSVFARVIPVRNTWLRIGMVFDPSKATLAYVINGVETAPEVVFSGEPIWILPESDTSSGVVSGDGEPLGLEDGDLPASGGPIRINWD